MKIIYPIALISVILQSQIRIVCWPLLPLAFIAGYVDGPKLFGLAFILGIFSDLVSGRLIGETVIFLLFFALLIQILKLRFKPSLKINLSAAFVFEIIYIVLINLLHF